MTDNNHDEKRQFSRIPFDAVAHINDQQGGLFVNCAVLDVSLNGLLLIKPEYWQGQIGEDYAIDLVIEQAQLVIKMSSSVAHIDNGQIGFKCTQLDLDSLTHLKRLVLLNQGDEALLHRELSALIRQ
jgi:hypothetical protein